MKKLIVILFALFYLQTIVGFSIGIHCCNGRIEYIKVFADLGNCHREHPDDLGSCCDEDEEPGSCCNEKTFYYQNNSEQLITHNWKYSFENNFADIREIQNDYSGLILKGNKIVDGNDCLPSPKARPSWLLYCSLTYYG